MENYTADNYADKRLDEFTSDSPEGYLYETHCHTNVSSACSKLSPEQIVELYVKNGYEGVFITDHFINGNCVQKIRLEKDYAKQIEAFFDGYRRVKEAGKGVLDVFCGFEASYKGTDVLVYGWDEEMTKRYSEITSMTMREFINFANAHGALTIQAHPFREAEYIDHIRLFPETAGIEVYNSSRDYLCNKLGYEYFKAYNEEYGKAKTAGSDIHIYTLKTLAGMAFGEKLKSEADFVERVKRGEGQLFRKKNVLAD